MKENIIPFEFQVSKKQRELRLNQKAYLIWFTGLSGSGKSTLSNAVEKKLFEQDYLTYSLDGDIIRNGISNNLNFSDEDRSENIRRIGEVCKLMLDAGLIVTASFISPFEKDRKLIANIVGKENYIEIYVNTPLAVCESRDVKGLYKKARSGQIAFFTGISSPFEPPNNPGLLIDTSNLTITESRDRILQYILKKLK